MGSLTSMSYFSVNLGATQALNLGLILVLTLVALQVFLELTIPALERGPHAWLAALWPRYRLVSTVLLVVFAGITFTKIMFTLSG